MEEIRRTHYGDPPVRPFEAAEPDPVAAEAIERHVETHLGPVEHVIHELLSDRIHVDVLVVPASAERPWTAIVTSGMSSRPMRIPSDLADAVSPYAELVMLLPPDWPPDADPGSAHGWPVFWLRHLARFPDTFDTWLGYWHGMPNGQPPEPLGSGTEFTGVLIMPPVVPGEAFRELAVSDGRTVTLLAVVPVLPDELEVKLRDGIDALLPGFEAHGVTELLDPTRSSSLG